MGLNGWDGMRVLYKNLSLSHTYKQNRIEWNPESRSGDGAETELREEEEKKSILVILRQKK